MNRLFDVTYSTKDDGIPLGNGQLTTTAKTIETQYFRGIGVYIGRILIFQYMK